MDDNNKHISVIGGALLIIGALTLASVTITAAVSSGPAAVTAAPALTRPEMVKSPMPAVREAFQEAGQDGVKVPIGPLRALCASLAHEVKAEMEPPKENMMQMNAKGAFPGAAPKPVIPLKKPAPTATPTTGATADTATQ
jgi:hypothetical protein